MLQMLDYVLRSKQMAVMENSRHWLISLAAIASAKTVLVTRMASDAGAAYS
jgi:hypothetical protein